MPTIFVTAAPLRPSDPLLTRLLYREDVVDNLIKIEDLKENLGIKFASNLKTKFGIKSEIRASNVKSFELWTNSENPPNRRFLIFD